MAMQLDEAQKQKVTGWIAEGRQLAEIQKLIESEFNIRLTYLDVRILVNDLKVMPKDIQREPEKKGLAPEAVTKPAVPGPSPAPLPDAPTGAPSGVSVTVDTIARPGAVVSGNVTFSDGQKATWYLDEMGRLGLSPQQQGYRPSAPDLQEFQAALQRELQGMGM
jgi:hypothetical protein